MFTHDQRVYWTGDALLPGREVVFLRLLGSVAWVRYPGAGLMLGATPGDDEIQVSANQLREVL